MNRQLVRTRDVRAARSGAPAAARKRVPHAGTIVFTLDGDGRRPAGSTAPANASRVSATRRIFPIGSGTSPRGPRPRSDQDGRPRTALSKPFSPLRLRRGFFWLRIPFWPEASQPDRSLEALGAGAPSSADRGCALGCVRLVLRSARAAQCGIGDEGAEALADRLFDARGVETLVREQFVARGMFEESV